MHYVKQFHINGVDTKQIACIELHGAPNAATEGAVGVLGMDVSSPTHEVYKCVAVNGSVYTWELLSAGMSIISAKVSGEGALTKTFSYEEDLIAPHGYIYKLGDLILDSEGYLYRVTAIWSEYCDTEYCGTHIGGIANGDKDYTFAIADGKLRLVTESGAIVSEVDTVLVDDKTIYRESSTGKAYVMGVRTVNDGLLRFFVGTQYEYSNLTDEQKRDLFAIITDEAPMDGLLASVNEHEETLKVHAKTLETHATTLETHTKDISENQKDIGALNIFAGELLAGNTVVPKASQVSPSIVTTVKRTNSYTGVVTLAENTVYLVLVEEHVGDRREMITSFILPIGEGMDQYWGSTIGGQSAPWLSEAGEVYVGQACRYIYRGQYYRDGGVNYFAVYKGDLTGAGQDDRMIAQMQGWHRAIFIKIADYPSLPED